MDYPELMTVEQVAEYLQMNRHTIYNMISKNKIPSIKIRGSRRIEKQALLKWIQSKGVVE